MTAQSDLRREAHKALAVLWQYASDLRHPPTGDSRERRIAQADATATALEAAIVKSRGEEV